MLDTRSARTLLATALVLAAAACSTLPSPTRPPVQEEPAGDGSWRGGFHGMLGYRGLDEDTWSGGGAELDTQYVLGVEFDTRPPDFPLGIEFGTSFSAMYDNVVVSGVDIDLVGSVWELYIGPRLTFDLADDSIHPYVGGGVTYLNAEIRASTDVAGVTITSEESEDSFAGYVHAGILFDLSESFHIGADGRFVSGSDLGNDADADYAQFALVLGSNW